MIDRIVPLVALLLVTGCTHQGCTPLEDQAKASSDARSRGRMEASEVEPRPAAFEVAGAARSPDPATEPSARREREDRAARQKRRSEEAHRRTYERSTELTGHERRVVEASYAVRLAELQEAIRLQEPRQALATLGEEGRRLAADLEREAAAAGVAGNDEARIRYRSLAHRIKRLEHMARRDVQREVRRREADRKDG